MSLLSHPVKGKCANKDFWKLLIQVPFHSKNAAMSDALTTSALPTSNRPKLPVQEDNEDSGIVCYEHCGRRFFVLSSLVASASCPTCSTALSRCQFGLPPFAMPQPFESAADRPMCLVIKLV